MFRHPVAIIGIASFLVGALIMLMPYQLYVNSLKSKAIETGAAEWLVDQKTGTTTFTWKESK